MKTFEHSIISHKGFTLIEMLVVIGIIMILMGAGIAGFDAAVKRAQTAKLVELVHEVQTALTTIYQHDNAWPTKVLNAAGGASPRLDAEVGAVLVKRGLISLSAKKRERDDGTTTYLLTGVHQFGIVTPWAEEAIKKNLKGGRLSVSSKVPTGGTVDDHILRFSVDDDGDGLTEVEGKNVRATACVWSCGRDGRFNTKDDVKSWSEGQVDE